MASPSWNQLLELYLNCAAAIAANQSYSVNGTTYTRANLKDVLATIQFLQDQVTDTATTTTVVDNVTAAQVMQRITGLVQVTFV